MDRSPLLTVRERMIAERRQKHVEIPLHRGQSAANNKWRRVLEQPHKFIAEAHNFHGDRPVAMAIRHQKYWDLCVKGAHLAQEFEALPVRSIVIVS